MSGRAALYRRSTRLAGALGAAGLALLGLAALFADAAASPVSPAVGEPLPRIQCGLNYTATIYAEGLSSPDGLAFSPAGELHVAEETAGRVSRIGPAGLGVTVTSGLVNPEGIAFDDAGNLYVVEDRPAGRLVKVTPGGITSTLAADLEAPEGVAWAAGGTLYVTESNLEFETNPLNFRTRLTTVSSSGSVTRVITNTPIVNGFQVTFWSYAGVTLGANGLPYLTNELSGQLITQTVGPFTFTLYTTDSVFFVNPSSGTRVLFAGGLTTTEGLRFSAGGDFPLYVAEENIGGGDGRLSRIESDGHHTPVCSGFFNIEDVAVDQNGRLYVSEDTSGLVIQLTPARRIYLPLVMRQS